MFAASPFPNLPKFSTLKTAYLNKMGPHLFLHLFHSLNRAPHIGPSQRNTDFSGGAAAAKSLQSCNPIDGSPPGSPSLGFSRQEHWSGFPFPSPMHEGASGKEPTCQCRRLEKCGFNPWIRKIPWRRAWQIIPVFLAGESHG